MTTARAGSPAFEAVIARFQEVRSEQTATILSRRNPGVLTWGVKFGDLDKIIKPYKRSQERSALARELWETGILEARSLALMLIEPRTLTEVEIDRWVEEVNYPYLADAFAGVVYRTPFRDARTAAWTRRPEEFVRRAGFSLVYNAAADPKNPTEDAVFAGYLDQIERQIHGSANWAREMMNMVPIAIGKRNDALYAHALRVTQAYGKVDVFHGDKTNCKIWNAVDALQDPKVHARRP
jgi:3-methyladenine DNA glycosylase AlkD